MVAAKGCFAPYASHPQVDQFFINFLFILSETKVWLSFEAAAVINLQPKMLLLW